FSNVPDGSNSRMGARFEPAHVFAPHLSATHILPWRSTATPAADPQGLPSGSFAQSSMVRYGLGWELGSAPASARALTPDAPVITTMNAITMNLTRLTCGVMARPYKLAFQFRGPRFYRVATLKFEGSLAARLFFTVHCNSTGRIRFPTQGPCVVRVCYPEALFEGEPTRRKRLRPPSVSDQQALCKRPFFVHPLDLRAKTRTLGHLA